MPLMPHACHTKWTWLKNRARRAGKTTPFDMTAVAAPIRASLRSRNTHGHLRGEFYYTWIYRKKGRPRSTQDARPPLCASLRSRKQDGHSTRATSCENLEEKSRRQDHAPWPHQAFATTVKTPQCGHTVRGKKHWILLQYCAPCLIPCGFPSLKGTHWVVGLYNIIAVRPKKQFDFVAVLGSMFSSLWVSQPHGEILGSRLITLHLYPEKSVWSSCSQ